MWWVVIIAMVILFALTVIEAKKQKPTLGLVISFGKADESVEGILRYAQGLVQRGYLSGVWVDDAIASDETREIVIRLARSMSGIEFFEGNPPHHGVDFIYFGHVEDTEAEKFMSHLRWLVENQSKVTYFSD